jgi:hypothetical protein
MTRRHRRPILLALGVVIVALLAILIGLHSGGKRNRQASSSPPVVPSSDPAPSTSTAPPTTSSTPPPPPPFATTEGPPVPTTGAYLGAWVYPKPYTQTGRVSSFTRYERAIGTNLSIVHLYRTWGQQIGTASDLKFARSGKYLLLSWAPTDLDEIVSGEEDSVIENTARQIAALPTKVFLEFRWEMDRPNLAHDVHGPQVYIAAWKHVRAIFAAQHVKNVAWTWCPTAAGFAAGRAQAYYPGNAEVDWVCADVYPTHAFNTASYETFAELARPFMNWAAAHPKPVIIGEYGVPKSYGSLRVPWLDSAGRWVQAHHQIKALVYFNSDVPDRPAFNHYSLLGDRSAIAAYRSYATDPYFQAANR